MNSISLPVKDGSPSDQPGVPCLETYLLTGAEKPLGAVLVCPGGAYYFRAPHEAGQIALAFNARGYHAFVVQYRVHPCKHPAPLSDAVHAMRLIRRNASEWGVDPAHIAVCGFSAGGHLAGSLGVLHETIPADGPDDPTARPDAMILCYAVLSAVSPVTHKGSIDNLLGSDAPDSLREKFSVPALVDKNTPPAFIWQTTDDPAVPVENALELASALRKAGVGFELHSYRHGGHGIGLADAGGDFSPRARDWSDNCAGWLEEIGFPRMPAAK